MHLEQMELVFFPIVLYRLALDRTMVHSSTLVCLESDVGAIKWKCFASVYLSVCL